MTLIHLYDDDGHYGLSVCYDKTMARYDMNRNAIVILAEGIKVKDNNDDDDGENHGNKYMKSKAFRFTQ